MSRTIPIATYRLQFHRAFTFDDAAQLVPYLHDLGISHCYASPYLKARTGSLHGYDIVDHNQLNPEVGDRASFNRFVAALHDRGMGQLLDIVPNHMGIGGDDNAWWLDVLENGPASEYASYFDIDWRPTKDLLQGKVLLPLLGDHYGTVLESGDLHLEFDGQAGKLGVRYYQHLCPLDPRTYPDVLEDAIGHLQGSGNHEAAEELHAISAAFGKLPTREDDSDDRRRERREAREAHQRSLAELCERVPAVAGAVASAVQRLNRAGGATPNFDALHALLEKQAYRLAYWQVASDEINYRRFFDINDLAGLRAENPEVFEATHQLIRSLVLEGSVDGLRIDHPDGLYDPVGYARRLQDTLHEQSREMADQNDPLPCYLVVEKILASYERLPEDWPVYGTTGYDFANLVNGVFVRRDGERALKRTYSRFIRRHLDFDDLLYDRKKLIIKGPLSSELTVLTNLLTSIADSDRHTRDYTQNGLREALTEVVSCFPVYRTYVTAESVTENDRRYVDWAVAQAKKRNPVGDVTIFDFVRDMLVLEGPVGGRRDIRPLAVRFAMKFQQYTAPVMAKGLEDTALYIYNLLVSLNEVGGDPRHFGTSTAAFHHANHERQQNWPHALLATSTHDNKRSEDVRARINVISEMPEEWRVHVNRWSRVNRAKKRMVNDTPAPSRNDEYLLYQTLLGAWPLGELDRADLAAFQSRIEHYMLKAMREAKMNTSWINPTPDYEEGVHAFVQKLLHPRENNAFLADFVPFQRHVARLGLFNSLSQTVLKLTAPGVPDIYQGNEMWDFSLVDPDNRRPVDFETRRRALQMLQDTFETGNHAEHARALLDHIDDGRAKLYLTWRALSFRRENAEGFEKADYVSLAARGAGERHLCAFARRHDGFEAIVVAARWFAALIHEDGQLPLGESVWGDTEVELPQAESAVVVYRNVLTGETLTPQSRDGSSVLAARDLFAHFPVALLHAGSP